MMGRARQAPSGSPPVSRPAARPPAGIRSGAASRRFLEAVGCRPDLSFRRRSVHGQARIPRHCSRSILHRFRGIGPAWRRVATGKLRPAPRKRGWPQAPGRRIRGPGTDAHPCARTRGSTGLCGAGTARRADARHSGLRPPPPPTPPAPRPAPGRRGSRQFLRQSPGFCFACAIRVRFARPIIPPAKFWVRRGRFQPGIAAGPAGPWMGR